MGGLFILTYNPPMDLQNHSQFLLMQKLTFLINRYEYFLYDNGEQGEQIAFVEQKRFAFREHITVWKNDHKSETLFTVRAEKILDVHGKFLVEDEAGRPLGCCRKAFGSSLLRSTWEVHDANGQVLFVAKEKSPVVAIIRRVLQFVPDIGAFANFVPFNFGFEHNGQGVGSHHRVWGSLSDRYALEVGGALKTLDRRLLLALGILLDALQDR